MTTSIEINISIEESFAVDCKIFDLSREYSDYHEKEKCAIATDLPEHCLRAKYGQLLSQFEPYILISVEQGNAMASYTRNENKHKMRQVRKGVVFNYDDGETEAHHSELLVDDVIEKVIKNNEIHQLYLAIDLLTKKQKERVIKHFICGLSSRQIAKLEGVNYSKVDESIRLGLKKLKIILDEGVHLTSPSAFK
jgi:predicted DNA-binding protein YlxM (UPF0122 family)